MNNNINNDINKFDGKYLKCIVSKYNAVTKYLSNSGAMIVLQPAGDEDSYKDNIKYHRNYIYLANEFLASGYGFLCKEMRDDAEGIVKVYHKTIERLDKADKDEATTREEKDAEIIKNFENYVAIEGGPIEKTTVTIDNVKIPTKDIILYGEEAKYDNLEVIEYSANINGLSTYYDDNTLLCPIGSKVKNISIYITTKDNDSGGIEVLKVLHNISLESSFINSINEQNEDIEAIIVNYNCDYDYTLEDDISSKYNLHKWYYSNTLNSDLIINGYKKNIIKGLYLYVKETPKSAYKFYPRLLERNPEWKIPSAGNIIKSNKIELNNSLSIRPQYYMKWVATSILHDLNNDTNTAPLNSFKDYDTTEVIIDFNSLGNTFNNKLYIEIPINFRIQKVYIIENNLNRYNITGAVVKSNSEYLLQCPFSSNNSNSTKYCIYYNIYYIEATNGFKPNTKLCVDVVYNYRKDEYDADYSNNSVVEKPSNYQENTSFTFDNVTVINDEDFNNLYWLRLNGSTPQPLTVENTEELKTKLEYFNENGVIKNN